MKTPIKDLDLFWVSRDLRPATPARCPRVPVYRVGEPLLRGRRQWPAGAQYSYGVNGHELTIFHPEVGASVMDDVRCGEAEFAAVIRLPVILIAYRFGASISWSDVPYCWHMQAAYPRVLPPLELSPQTRALVWITLVNTTDGIIHAQRGMTLAPEFTRVLHDAIRVQAMTPFQPDHCLAAVDELLIAHPSVTDRLTLASVRAIGNQ